MKKLYALIFCLLLSVSAFAKTTQIAKSFQVRQETTFGYDTKDVSSDIQKMINSGWKVVSVTPVTCRESYSNPTYYLLVIFEKEL